MGAVKVPSSYLANYEFVPIPSIPITFALEMSHHRYYNYVLKHGLRRPNRSVSILISIIFQRTDSTDKRQRTWEIKVLHTTSNPRHFTGNIHRQ